MKGRKSLALIGSICLILVLVASALFTACAKEAAPTTTTPATTTPAPTTPKPTTPAPTTPAPTTPAPTTPTTYKWPASLKWVPHSIGSSDHTYITAMAPILEKITGMRSIVTVDSDPNRRIVDAMRGRYITTNAPTELPYYYLGIGGGTVYEKEPTRVLWSLYDAPYSFYVKPDSPIKSVYDLKTMKGVRVGVNELNTIDTDLCRNGLPAFVGLTSAEADKLWTFVPFGNYNAYATSVIDGTADVASFACASALAYQIESSPGGIRILELPPNDAEAWARYSAASIAPSGPGLIPYGIPTAVGKGGYLMYKVALVSPDYDQNLAYNLAKYFGENYDTYKGCTASAARTTLEQFRSMLDSSIAPIAEGTIKYLKEVGVWKAEDDKWNQAAIDIQNLYIQAGKDAWAQAKKMNVTIAADSPEWLALWDSYIKKLPPFTHSSN